MKTVETGLNQIIQVNDGNWMTSVAYQDQFWFRTENFHKSNSNVAEALLFCNNQWSHCLKVTVLYLYKVALLNHP